jgi:hypothetical protein
MKIGTQTKTGMLSLKVTKAEAYGKEAAKITGSALALAPLYKPYG